MTHRQWFSGFDRQLPQRQLAFLAQGDAEKISLAHRHAAGGENQVHMRELTQPLPCLR
ncbi:hypothetical protein D3C78_1758370 [compost metagenome]